MAVQTIILRPNGQTKDASGIATVVPSGTPSDSLYLLINEAIPDDDATYIAGGSAAEVSLTFPTEQIVNITPIAIRVVARMKNNNSESQWGVEFSTYCLDGTTVSTLSVTKLYCEKYNVYETVTGPIDNFEVIKNRLPDANFAVGFDRINGSSNKNDGPNLTQLYLEVDYDDEVVSDKEVPFYLKQSGIWQSVSGEVYKKINGVWATSTLDELSAGDQIVVVEHN